MVKEVYGYAGKILRVDLSTGTIATEPTIKYARKWLGGRGIGQAILYRELKPGIAPYDPANIIVIETGPLTGTLAPTATRYSLASKNVFSNGVGTANSCGFFGPELKFAGYDHIVVQGKASLPVYLWLSDDHVEVRSAKGVWGKTTWETDALIKKELGDEDIQVICIGPAGENLVKAACVITDGNRAAARCGLGGVMGSKNLKAVAVRGTGAVRVAHPDRFMKAVDNAFEKLEKSPRTHSFTRNGTLLAFPHKNELCSVPYKNFQDAHVPEEAMERITPDIFREYKQRNISYMACPIACGGHYKVDEGPYCGLVAENLETNSLANFAGKLALDYAPAILKAHALCNQLGLDLDNATGALSWAFESFQRGILTSEDTDGLNLEWGDYEVVLELIKKMAYREGFGRILAEGSKRAAEIIGRDSGYYAIHMKGQDLYEEVRLPIAWGLGVCLATRGGGHTTGAALSELLGGDPEVAKRVFGVSTAQDPTTYEEKPQLVIYYERITELANSLMLCVNSVTFADPTQMSFGELAELYSAATGWETTAEELVRIADRILNIEKAFNVLHANLGHKDDYPPERCWEPIKSGKFKGFTLSREKFERMLREYYQLRGWEPSTGRQTRRCLEALDLADVADDLEEANKLAVT